MRHYTVCHELKIEFGIFFLYAGEIAVLYEWLLHLLQGIWIRMSDVHGRFFVQKFESTDSLQNIKAKQCRVLDEEQLKFWVYCHVSNSVTLHCCKINRSIQESVRKILKSNKCFPYKMRILQELSPNSTWSSQGYPIYVPQYSAPT